jgi:type IV pilus assembly protein PilW
MRHGTATKRRRLTSGFTLVELMVSLTIASFLMIGATTVYMQGRTTFRVTESISRLQEDARFALDTLEPDIRMTGYLGLRSRPDHVLGRATELQPTPAGLGVAGDCGPNWSINLDRLINGANNDYDWTCAAFGGEQPTADTLVIRRVAEDPDVVPAPGAMYVQSARFQDSQLFVGPVVPAGFAATTSASHRLVVNGYYVSQTSSISTPGNPIPSLRMKTLIGGPSGPQIEDREILPGVEDLQVQFGVDTDPIGTVNRGSVNRYVNPDDPIIDPNDAFFDPNAQIIAVRIWLRVRAERRENGFSDDNSYTYADQNVAPFNDAYRRVLVTKTIYLRNARKTI